MMWKTAVILVAVFSTADLWRPPYNNPYTRCDLLVYRCPDYLICSWEKCFECQPSLCYENYTCHVTNQPCTRKNMLTSTETTPQPPSVNISSRSQWGAVPPNKPPILIHNAVPWVVIHHSEGNNDCSGKPCRQIVKNIQHFHMNGKKWSDIAYNFLVAPTGEVFEGRGWGVVGAHAPNYNSRSLGICLIGNYQVVTPPEVQLRTVQDLITTGVDQGKIQSTYHLVGHRQVRNTPCPGDKLYSIIQTWPRYYKNNLPRTGLLYGNISSIHS